MKNWLAVIVLGMIAVLAESSLLGWPWLLLVVWGADIDERAQVLGLVLMGVVLDVLMVRTVGMSGVYLLIFWLGLRMVRELFGGSKKSEYSWLILAAVAWNWLLGGGMGILEITLYALVVLAIFTWGGSGLVAREIRLK